MPTEPNLSTVASMSPDVMAVWMADQLLERAERDTVFWAAAKKTAIPKGEGKTVQFTRYERLPLPSAPIEESVSPPATPITLSTVQAVLDQWGAVASASDVVQLVIKHPLVQEAKDLLSDQHDELVDRELQVVCMGTTGVYFAGNVLSRAALTAASVLRSDDIRRLVANLRSAGAPAYERGLYRGIVDPYVEADISKDPTFVNAGTYSQVETLRNFTIGKWLGVEWDRSNYIPVVSLMTAAHATSAANTTVPGTVTGFDTSSTVRVVVTREDPSTGFETLIDAREDVTSGSNPFTVDVTVAAAAPSGLYRFYLSLQGGAIGTSTLQAKMQFTTGTLQVIRFAKSGTPATSSLFIVNGTGPVAPPIPPASVNVHISYVFGRGWLGATELDGLHTYVTPATASDSDPLAQRTKFGWKQLFKGLILNPAYGYRVESASEFN